MSIAARFALTLGNFSLSVEIVLPSRGVSALFGPSGAGKTTLLRCIAGLERAPDGRLEVNGETWQDSARNVFVPPHRRALGVVFQDARLFAHLSVRGNLEFGWKRIVAVERRVAFAAAVELLGIGHLLDRLPERLSGGEVQRVAIARALLTSPQLLLLDEPLAALDHVRKAEILPYLERLHDELSIPVIYISHAADEVARLADTLVLLDQGRVLAAGPLAEILSRPDLSLAHGDHAAVVVEAKVAAHDAEFALTRVDFPGGSFWISGLDKPLGARVRVRVQARDVSIVVGTPSVSSIINVLPATVVAVDHDAAGRSLVRLRLGEALLLARVTRRSAVTLGLTPGLAVHAQIKGVVLLG